MSYTVLRSFSTVAYCVTAAELEVGACGGGGKVIMALGSDRISHNDPYMRNPS